VQIAETRDPQRTLEPFGQLVGRLGGGISIRKGFLADKFAVRSYKGVLDDKVFLAHGVGCHHLDVLSLHRHLRRMGALLAGPPARVLLGVDKGDGKGACRLPFHGAPYNDGARK